MADGRFAGLLIGTFTLPASLLLVIGHNRWAWDPSVFITLAGWAMLAKSVAYLLFPDAATRVVSTVKDSRKFVWVGAAMT
ncbi:MAG TPA: hypothetical protein VFX98_02650, partial [Longimicrobiaceae bacterium]|nr:hypothetical protein [Longimicrobiaceae bacterium]